MSARPGDLRKRVSQYFHPSRRMGWDLKFNALVEAIHDFDWHVVEDEPEVAAAGERS
jgi:excinuclease ABC subunit C